ncbi:MAG: hypothetical protein Q9211_005259 [Gyalolechia sp. 1 TL-2023]
MRKHADASAQPKGSRNSVDVEQPNRGVNVSVRRGHAVANGEMLRADLAGEADKQEPIAIVGAACRFAGDASSLGSLWDVMSKVRTGHGAVPSDRWDSKSWYHPDPDRKGGISSQGGYFLQQDISHFDAPFFSMTAKEAAVMDPMKRLLLEVSYESIENGIMILRIHQDNFDAD